MDRRLTAIMMADLAGYTALMEENAPAAIAQVRHMRETAIEPIVRDAGGKVEKRMGDGWLITFPSARSAVDAAKEVQNGLADNTGLKLRLAVHLGEIFEEDGEIYGTGINISARLQAQAPPGGMILSSDCHRQLDPKLADTFDDAGTFELKNVKAKVSCFQWRPNTQVKLSKPKDEVPVISVETFAAVPASSEFMDASSDLEEQVAHRLAQRTGLRINRSEATEGIAPNATYILRGRLRARANKAQFLLSLLRANSLQVSWSEKFESDFDDIFEFTDEVADKAINALRVQLNAFDGERIQHLDESVLTPSELRSRAAQLFHKAKIKHFSECDRLLQRALSLDPDHPTSLAMLCLAKLWPALAKFCSPSNSDLQWITQAADLAVAGAPRSYFVFFVRAQVRLMAQGDVKGAQQDLKRALQLNPGYSWGLETLGHIDLMEERYATAVEIFENVVSQSQSDPLLPRRLFWLALALTLDQQFEKAQSIIDEALEILPDFAPYWFFKSHLLTETGNSGEAKHSAIRASASNKEPSIFLIELKLSEPGKRLLRKLHSQSVSD